MRTFDATQTAIVASDAISEISWLFEIDKDGDGDIDYYWSNKSKVWNGNTYEFYITDFSPIRMERNRSEYGINAPPAFNFTVSNPATALYPSNFSGGNVTVRLVMKGDGPALNSSSIKNCPNASYQYQTFSGASATGFHAESDGTLVRHLAVTELEIPFVTGNRYSIDFDLVLYSGELPYYYANIGDYYNTNISGAPTLQAVNGHNHCEFTSGETCSGVIEWYNELVAAHYTVSNFSVSCLSEAEISSWNFDFAGVSPIDQTLKFECQSWIQKYKSNMVPMSDSDS